MKEWISVDDRLPELNDGVSEYVLMAVSIPWDNNTCETMPMVGFLTWNYRTDINAETPEDKSKYYCLEWVLADRVCEGGTPLWDIDFEYAVTHWMPLPQVPEGITPEICYKHDLCSLDEEDDDE